MVEMLEKTDVGALPLAPKNPRPGNNLFDLTHEPWLPRRRALQPIFTKQHVRAFAGHMSQAAETVCASWVDGAEIDLDAECRRLTLRALGRSALGLNLDERADALAAPLRVALGGPSTARAQSSRARRHDGLVTTAPLTRTQPRDSSHGRQSAKITALASVSR